MSECKHPDDAQKWFNLRHEYAVRWCSACGALNSGESWKAPRALPMPSVAEFKLGDRVRVNATGDRGVIELYAPEGREPRWYVRLGPTNAGWRLTSDLSADSSSSAEEVNEYNRALYERVRRETIEECIRVSDSGPRECVTGCHARLREMLTKGLAR